MEIQDIWKYIQHIRSRWVPKRANPSIPTPVQRIQKEKGENLMIAQQNSKSHLRMLLTFKTYLATPLDTILGPKEMLM